MGALGRPAAAIGARDGGRRCSTRAYSGAIHWGHPEELLGGALCVGAVIAAARGRSIAAGLLLGLAVATKQWALIAVIPTVLAAPRRRLPLAVVGALVAAALTLPMMFAAPKTFVAVHKQAAQAGGPIGPANVWWTISSPRTAEERAAHLTRLRVRDPRPGWPG